MRVTLTLNGQEITFTGEELTSIINSSNAKSSKLTGPIEDELFEIRPAEIDQDLFYRMADEFHKEYKRMEFEIHNLFDDKIQTLIKKANMLDCILDALKYVEPFDGYFYKPFFTMYPSMHTLAPLMSEEEKTEGICTYIDLEGMFPKELGWHFADWKVQGLEWAQRICNGEKTFNELFSEPDTANSYRAVLWYNNTICRIGGCKVYGGSAMHVEKTVRMKDRRGSYHCVPDRLKHTVPLFYKL